MCGKLCGMDSAKWPIDCILKEENLLGFLSRESDNYILMQTKRGEIFSVKRRSLSTFIGRKITWLTGSTYELPALVMQINNSLCSKQKLSKNEKKIVERINRRILSYNSKPRQDYINSITYKINASNNHLEFPAVGEKSEVDKEISFVLPNGKKTSPSTASREIPISNQTDYNNFAEQQAKAREKYAEQPRADADLQVWLDRNSGNLQAIPRKPELVGSVWLQDHKTRYFVTTMDLALPKIFHLYEIGIIKKAPFFKFFVMIGGDRHKGLSSLANGGMDRSSATNTIVLKCRDFEKLKLTSEEETILMQTTRFLLHAANANGKHSEECKDSCDCTLPIAAFEALDPLIEKISAFIQDNQLKDDNGFSFFAEHIQRLKKEISSRVTVKSANMRWYALE